MNKFYLSIKTIGFGVFYLQIDPKDFIRTYTYNLINNNKSILGNVASPFNIILGLIGGDHDD